MPMTTFDDVLRHARSSIIEQGYVDKRVCEAAAPADSGLLASIILHARPKTRIESEALGYLTSVCAEMLPKSGPPLRLTQTIHYVGYALAKPDSKIMVTVDAGDFVGAFMTAGTIVCEQSCGDFAFRGARGGRGVVRLSAGEFCGEDLSESACVHVHGDVGNSAGRSMTDGELTVERNAGEFFCRYVRGGVAVAGSVALLGETYGDNIRARQVQAFEKGAHGIHKAKLSLRTCRTSSW